MTTASLPVQTSSLWQALSSRWQPAPRAAAAAAAARQAPEPTVLVVQDQKRALEAMAAAVGDIGVAVVACGDPGEGLAAFALLDGPAVLVLDVALRGVACRDMATAFRAACPHGVVVYATGLGDGARLIGPLGPRDALLHKPFGARELRLAVRRALALAFSPVAMAQ